MVSGEVKTLMIQLLRAVAHLHDNWILHRDLKTSNLLLSNKGILKVQSEEMCPFMYSDMPTGSYKCPILTRIRAWVDKTCRVNQVYY